MTGSEHREQTIAAHVSQASNTAAKHHTWVMHTLHWILTHGAVIESIAAMGEVDDRTANCCTT